jgi:hypothetical protein
VSATRSGELGKLERGDDCTVAGRLDAVLGVLLTACQAIVHELHPFLPDSAARIEHALEQRDPNLGRTLFPKVVVAA